MVQTRSQKRKYENYDIETQEIISIQQGNQLIAIIKKKKIDDSIKKKENKDNSNIEEIIEESNFNDKESNFSDKKSNFSDKESNFSDVIKNPIKKYTKKNIDKDFVDDNSTSSKNSQDDYDEFNYLIETIYSGDFFEHIPLEDQKKKLKKNLTVEEIKEFNSQLNIIQDVYRNNGPSVIDILKMKIPLEQKQKLLERLHHFINNEVLSPEYNTNLKFLNTNINVNPELLELENSIKQKAVKELSYKDKILRSKMPFDNKVITYQKLEIMETYEESNSDDFIKYKNWIDSLLSIPFGKYINIPVNKDSSNKELQNYIKSVRETLDKNLSFLEKPKDQIINIVSQMIRNPDCNINAIGLHGVKGTGKSSIGSSIAEALGRPLKMISLGGESDSSSLTGHGFTYVGSQPGRITEILRESKIMNAVVLIDEIDKLSQTHQGKEIIGTLIHLTDSSTNNKYNLDRYYSGIEFDLSKVLFIFTYNDPSKVDKILADRLYKIKVDNYNFKEKLEITNKHLISTILEKLNLQNENISFADDAINYLVQTSSSDEGMRNIKTKIKIILSRINVLLLTNKDDKIINLKYSKLYDYYNNKNTLSDDAIKSKTLIIPKEHIDILLDESISTENDQSYPPFGMYI